MTYEPRPIETSHIELPADLERLVERLAESTHDHWALKRLEEGWTYGSQRDDESRTHPDLVPYGRLSDSEKEYDRRSVIETLKAILALGYEIGRRDSSDGG
jgi:hypothetical protein